MVEHHLDIEQLSILDCEEGLSAVRLHGHGFPMQAEDKPQLIALLKELRHSVQKRHSDKMRLELFIQMPQLPRPEGAELLSKNGSRWMPGLAMGVWPDREPPRTLTKEDFTHRLPGQKLPVLAYEARKILAKDEAIRLEIEEQMVGSGALLEIIAPEGWSKSEGRQVEAWLKGKVIDDSYRNYPSYVPLLDAKSLAHLSPQDREACLAGITLYLREDLTDQSILIISRTSFEETLEMITGTAQKV
jgi:hypothetical protein